MQEHHRVSYFWSALWCCPQSISTANAFHCGTREGLGQLGTEAPGPSPTTTTATRPPRHPVAALLADPHRQGRPFLMLLRNLVPWAKKQEKILTPGDGRLSYFSSPPSVGVNEPMSPASDNYNLSHVAPKGHMFSVGRPQNAFPWALNQSSGGERAPQSNNFRRQDRQYLPLRDPKLTSDVNGFEKLRGEEHPLASGWRRFPPVAGTRLISW